MSFIQYQWKWNVTLERLNTFKTFAIELCTRITFFAFPRKRVCRLNSILNVKEKNPPRISGTIKFTFDEPLFRHRPLSSFIAFEKQKQKTERHELCEPLNGRYGNWQKNSKVEYVTRILGPIRSTDQRNTCNTFTARYYSTRGRHESRVKRYGFLTLLLSN